MLVLLVIRCGPRQVPPLSYELLPPIDDRDFTADLTRWGCAYMVIVRTSFERDVRVR